MTIFINIFPQLPTTKAANSNCTLNVFTYEYSTPTSICTDFASTTTQCLSSSYRNTTLCDYTIEFALLDSTTENASMMDEGEESAFKIDKFDPCSDFFSLGFHNHPNPIPLTTSNIMIVS